MDRRMSGSLERASMRLKAPGGESLSQQRMESSRMSVKLLLLAGRRGLVLLLLEDFRLHNLGGSGHGLDFDFRRGDADDRQLSIRPSGDAFGKLDVFHVDGVSNVQRRNVDTDDLGQILGQTLHFEGV